MSYKYPTEIDAAMYALEARIIADILRRIKKTGEITSTADYQIGQLYELGYSSAEIEETIMKGINGTYADVWELYDKAAEQAYTRDKTLYEQINGRYIPYEDNNRVQRLVEVAKTQTAGTFENLTQTAGVITNVNGQMTFLPLTTYYKQTLDKAVLDISSGAFDYNSVLRRTVKDLSRSGIRVIDYASGYSSRLPVAARRAVMTAMSQMTGAIAEMNAEELGTDTFEVDWHTDARPEHAEWQGGVYTYDELCDVCGLGSVTGLHGVNCYHDYMPFIPGISVRRYSDEWLAEQRELAQQTTDYDGKSYTPYEAKQEMRNMETSMRATRTQVAGMKQGGGSAEEIQAYQAKYKGQMDEYKSFCDAMGTKSDMSRVYIDGLGRIA